MSLCWHDYGDGEHATQYPAMFVIQRVRPWKWELTERVGVGDVSRRSWMVGERGTYKTLRAAKEAADVIARDKAAG